MLSSCLELVFDTSGAASGADTRGAGGRNSVEPRTSTPADELKAAVGEQLGYTDWLEIDQKRIDLFADATGDHQWIHVDAEKAAAGPLGTTIAHGYLTLSLLPYFSPQLLRVEGVRMGVNYGSNKVRFPSPVPVGSRLRATGRIA